MTATLATQHHIAHDTHKPYPRPRTHFGQLNMGLNPTTTHSLPTLTPYTPTAQILEYNP